MKQTLIKKEEEQMKKEMINISLRRKPRLHSTQGITLIALVITIIILIILAGVAVNLSVGQNGIFVKAKQAAEMAKREAVVEELEIAITQIQADMIEKNQNITMEEIVKKLKENENKYLEEEIQALNTDGTGGIYKDYEFYIENKTYKIIIEGDTKQDEDIQLNSNKNVLLLNGSTYLNTNITQENLVQNSEFTIAARVFINSYKQKTISNMSILGNHNFNNGFVWQFSSTTNNLQIYLNGLVATIDYTPYYDNWTNIVMTYNNSNVKVYINGILVGSAENLTLMPYNNIIIGTGFLGEDRTMKGAIQSIKVWNKELAQEEVSKINYDVINTNIQEQNIIEEFNFDSIEEIQSKGTITGNDYDIISKNQPIRYEVKLNGGCFLDVNLAQDTLLSNSMFTIAARVKINSEEQQTITSMGILGNHTAASGMAWQFSGNSNILQIGFSNQGRYLDIDYTPYYGKFVDIVMVYSNGTIQVYIDKVKIVEDSNMNLVANGNLYIGSSYGGGDRGISGYLPYVKVWNTALNESEINTLNMEKMDTDIQKTNLLKELDLRTMENIETYGTFYGSNYSLELVK